MTRRRRIRHRGDPTLAVGYQRCSTDRQDLSPRAQRHAIEQWATANNVTVVSWHFDKGVSGTAAIEDRSELVGAIASVKAAGAGRLIVARRDRLARDTLVAQLVERAVEQVGGSVVSADGVGNGDDPASRMVRSILDAVSGYEAAVIRSRIRAALMVKKRQGQRVGAIPYGFQLDDDGLHLVPVASEQAVIAKAIALREQGAEQSLGFRWSRCGFGARSVMDQVKPPHES